MDRIFEMLQTHPKIGSQDMNALAECIAECYQCAQTCTACADACLSEDEPHTFARCIRLNLDCADICRTTGNLLTRQTQPDGELIQSMLDLCADACRVCGQESGIHAEHHEHCRVCAEECLSCQRACENLLAAMPTA